MPSGVLSPSSPLSTFLCNQRNHPCGLTQAPHRDTAILDHFELSFKFLLRYISPGGFVFIQPTGSALIDDFHLRSSIRQCSFNFSCFLSISVQSPAMVAPDFLLFHRYAWHHPHVSSRQDGKLLSMRSPPRLLSFLPL